MRPSAPTGFAEAAVIAASALLGFANSEVDLMVVAMEIYRIADTPVLLAIPLFTFAGYLVGESQAPRRLVQVSNALLGWMPGGLAVVWAEENSRDSIFAAIRKADFSSTITARRIQNQSNHQAQIPRA